MTAKKQSGVDKLTIICCTLMMVLAASTFVVSYCSLVELAQMAGIQTTVAYLWPFGLDGLMVIAALVRMNYSLRGDDCKDATFLLLGTVVLSVVLNVAHVIVNKIGSVPMWILIIDSLVFAVPPSMLFFSSEVTLRMLKEVIVIKQKTDASKKRAAARAKKSKV